MTLIQVQHQSEVPVGMYSSVLLGHHPELASKIEFTRDFDLPIENEDWKIGVIVGPSGSGKTSIGERLWDGKAMWDGGDWPESQAIVEAIVPGGSFDDVTGALASVGLGDVPAWLRPYHVLSNGEQFRAQLARIIAERPERVVVDEFSSVVDRQIACIGALAFAKSWRRTGGQVVLLTPHYDVLNWLDPDWVLDTATGDVEFTKGLYERPKIDVAVRETRWGYWKYFKPHHYLDAGPMAFSTAFVGFVDDDPVVHMGMSGHHIGHGRREARACRMVVMPEWQGAGISFKFMNYLCEREMRGEGFISSPVCTQFHTAHPALCKVLRRDDRWRQISQHMHGVDGGRATALRKGPGGTVAAFGAHWRVVQGFRFYGQRGIDKANEVRARKAEQARAALDAEVKGRTQ